MASTITLLTDFGLSDTYVGQMKGMIARISPEAQVIDLSHQVPPQDVLAAAVMLADAVDAFPDNTVHVAVVDPEVGMDRVALAVDIGPFRFVGPDNGLVTPLLERYGGRGAVALDPGRLRVRRLSSTFHGRDVFAPAAAYLAKGERLTDLGSPVRSVRRLEMPRPDITPDQVTAHVLIIDHFGNLVTDLTHQQVADWQGEDQAVSIAVGHTRIQQIHRTFAEVSPGEPVAYFGSAGRLEIAVRNGNAAAELEITRLQPVTLRRK